MNNSLQYRNVVVKSEAAVCDVWQVADALATFLVRNRFAVATDNFKWYSRYDPLVLQTAIVLLVVLRVVVLREENELYRPEPERLKPI